MIALDRDHMGTCQHCGTEAWVTVECEPDAAWFVCGACGRQNDLDPETLTWLHPEQTATPPEGSNV